MKTTAGRRHAAAAWGTGIAMVFLAASLARGQTITNPSFEAETYTVWPGYMNNNTPITGWAAANPSGCGLNPVSGGASPFADNGAIPDGAQVAFLQGGSAIAALSTTISGLTTGASYRLAFRANARGGQTPNLRVTLDGQAFVDAPVTSVGGANPYKPVAFDFTASAAEHTLSVSNYNAGDNTLLIDDFRVEAASGRWAVAAWSDDASSGVISSGRYTHAYRFNSAAAVVLNGIRFAGLGGGNPAVAGSFATAGFPNGAGDGDMNLSGASAGLNTFLYGGAAQSVTLSNLTPGTEYELTLFSVAWENPPARGITFGVGADRTTVDQDAFGNNNGIRISYRYTADSSGTVTLDLTPLNGSSSFHMYALCNRETAFGAWTYQPWGDDASSGVDPQARHTHAYTFGTASREYLNQVLFAGVPGANPSVAGRFATAGLPSTFANDPNNLSGAYMSRLVANDFAYGGASESLTLEGLTPGTEYILTLFSVGWEIGNRRVLFAAGADSVTVNQNLYGNNAGLALRYRYTAGPEGTLAVSMTAQDSGAFHCYGFANREAGPTAAPYVLYLSPNQWVGAGDTASFAVTNGGTGPFAYQWRKAGTNLTDQTNAVLNLSNAVSADAGAYDVVIANGSGAVTSDTVTLDVGVRVDNPSFEADVFTNSPGYVNDNIPITSWASTLRAGLNPILDGQSPFMNLAMIPPNGRQACFIQDDGVLAQGVTNLTPGKNYYLKFYENARRTYATPTLSVRAEGLTVVPTHPVPPDTPTLFRAVTSAHFLATSATGLIEFVKGNLAGGDNTLVLDLVAILEYPATAPGITLQPLPQALLPGEPLTLAAAATGSYPLVFQWRKNGADLTGENGTSLVISAVSLGDAGDYDVVVTNEYGAATSVVAGVTVGGAFSGLYNTGIGSNGTLAAGGEVDPHYRLIWSDDPAFPGPDAVVMLDAWPIPPYLANGPNSKWITPHLNTNGYSGNAAGIYAYRTEFVLDSVSPTGAVLTGAWGSDNEGLDIRLNGFSLGIGNAAGFGSLAPFTITNGLVAGVNTLDFVITNALPPGPTALRVELRGSGVPLPAGPPVFLVQPTNLLVQDGQPARFDAIALGAGPLTYQWFNDGIPLDETNRTYIIPSAGEPLQGTYWVVVNNPDGAATSAVVTLSVNQAPTVSNSTAATIQDQVLVLDQAKLLLYVNDPDGDTNLAVIVAGPTSTNGGTVALGATNVTYTPPAGYMGADLFTFVVDDGHGATGTGLVEVTVLSGEAQSMNIVFGPRNIGSNFVIRFAGVPGYWYTIEASPRIVMPVWNPVTNIMAPTNDLGFGVGVFQFTEPAGLMTTRFYRTVGPP